MQTDSSAPFATDEKLTFTTLLKRTLGLYRRHRRFLTAVFLPAALARCLWTIAQFAFVRYRHPEWPVAGLLINQDWGLSLYWTSIALTWTGWFLYAVLMGPGIAVASRAALNSIILADAHTSPAAPHTCVRSLRLQLLAILRASAIFLLGFVGTSVVGSTFLASNTDAALLLWYALVAFTFFIGLPIAVLRSLRYALVVPAAINEKFSFASAIDRSIQMTRGAGPALFAALGCILAVRLALGITVACVLGLLAQSVPAVAPLATFVFLPLGRCLLDAVSGPLLGTSFASLYAQKAASELRALPQMS